MAFVTILNEQENLKRVSDQHTHMKFQSDILKASIPRSQWATALKPNQWMWAAGGGSYVINNRFVVLVQRSSTAPTNPGALTVLTGVSENTEEILNPMFLLRELFEEVVIQNKDGKILVPTFASTSSQADHSNHPPSRAKSRDLLDTRGSLDFARDGGEFMTHTFQFVDLNHLAKSSLEEVLKPFQRNFQFFSVQASIMEKFLNSHLSIESSGKPERSFKGLLHFGEKTRSINFMIPVAIDLPENFMTTFRFFDTETAQDKNGESVFLNRRIFFFELPTGCLFDHRGNFVSKAERPMMTEHASYFLQNFKEHNREL